MTTDFWSTKETGVRQLFKSGRRERKVRKQSFRIVFPKQKQFENG